MGRHKNRLVEENKEKIINEYLSGKTVINICLLYGYNKNSLMNMLKRENIPRRNKEDRNRKYNLNRNFFDKIDTQEKAYFLGFMYADGYNHEKSNTIMINLQEKDREILEKLAKIIEYDGPLMFWKKRQEHHQNQWRLSISSKKISKRLVELGCPKKKSFIIVFPEWLDKELIPHFIRGYFDGDGSIWKVKNRKGEYYTCSTCIASTLSICESIRKILLDKFNIMGFIRKETGCYTITISGGINVEKFLMWIYSDATVFMQRKYDKYQEFLKFRKIIKDKNEYKNKIFKYRREDFDILYNSI